MKFLIIFIALILQPYISLPKRSTRSRTFAAWLALLNKLPNLSGWPHPLRWGAVVLIPCGIFGGSAWLMSDFMWGLPLALAEIALLVFVLSHMSIQKQLEDYKKELANGDIKKAFTCAEKFLSVPNVKLNDSAASMNDQVIKSLLHRWFEYFFLMVFWYTIADVPGLILAWTSLQFARSPDTDGYAWRYLYWIEWLPTRLLGLTYALAGDFIRVLPRLKNSLTQWYLSSADILFDLASHALRQQANPLNSADVAHPSSQINKNAHSSSADSGNLNSGNRNSENSDRDNSGENIIDNNNSRDNSRSDNRVDDNYAIDGQYEFEKIENWQALHWRSLSIWMIVLALATVGGVFL